MNLEFKHLLPQDFDQQSRVWIYQSNRLFMLSEALEMEEEIEKFCASWQAHGAKVTAYGNLFFGQFLVLMADERATGVSGCSTDSSVRFVKDLGQRFRADFFDRTSLAFFIKDKIQVLPLNQLQYAFENGFINEDTLYFNNTVTSKEAMEKEWIQPVKESWLGRRLKVGQ
jgi:hypothetical protein